MLSIFSIFLFLLFSLETQASNQFARHRAQVFYGKLNRINRVKAVYGNNKVRAVTQPEFFKIISR